MKKIIALVLTLAMIMMVGAAAFAADDTPAFSKKMTVAGLDEGDEAYFYQIAKWMESTSYANDGVLITGWTPLEPYSTLDPSILSGILYEDPVTGLEQIGITPELAVTLAQVVNNPANNISADYSTTVGSDGKAEVTATKPGMYMVLVKPYNTNTLYNPMFVSADFVHDSQTLDVAAGYKDSTAKKSTLKIEKTADNANDYTGDHAKTTAVGDVVTFTVKVTVPAYGNAFTNPYFVLKDKLTDLELTEDAITVSDLTEGNQYSLGRDSDNKGYTITFAQGYLRSLKTASELTVTYKAKVTTTAVKAINEETNDVMIEYSHDPTNVSDYDVQKDTTQHYTFTIDAAGLGEHSSVEGKKTSEVVKIGIDAAGNPITQTTEKSEITEENTWTGPLAGAKFGLWKNSTCEGEAYLEAITGEDGRMTFAGLDAGTYYLKEISAPTGFVTNTDIHTVVLAAETDTVKVTEYYDPADQKWYSANNEAGTRKAATYDTEILKKYSVKIDGQDVSTYNFTNDSTSNNNEIKWTTLDPVELPCQLTNIQGTQLPSTGGIGTTIFYILGGLLVVGAVVILVARRKAQD